jgi:hypothetical protein
MEKLHVVDVCEGSAKINTFNSFTELVQWLVDRVLLSEVETKTPRIAYTWGEEEGVILPVASELWQKLQLWSVDEETNFFKFDYLEAIQRLTKLEGYPDNLELIFIKG